MGFGKCPFSLVYETAWKQGEKIFSWRYSLRKTDVNKLSGGL